MFLLRGVDMRLKILNLFFLLVIPSLLAIPDEFKTVSGLRQLFSTYPEIPHFSNTRISISKKDFCALMDEFISVIQRKLKGANASGGVGYAQGWVLGPEHRIFVVGDIHGSLFSLLRQLDRWVLEGVMTEDLRLLSGYSLVFIGDYVDRTVYGLECLTIMLLLALINEDRVVLLRGNHESVAMNNSYADYGFTQEIRNKYSREAQEVIDQLDQLYLCFTLTLYVGCGSTLLQFCHGAPEPKNPPIELILGQDSFFSLLEKEELESKNVNLSHYLWTDIIHHDPAREAFLKQGDYLAIESSLNANLFSSSARGHDLVSADLFAIDRILKSTFVDALIRGHQDMIAVLKLFREKEVIIDTDTMVNPFTDPRNAPLNWVDVVEGRNPEFYMKNYGPVFTLSAASGSKIDSEGCVEIILAKTYDKCVMKVYDYPLLPYNQRVNNCFRWRPSGNVWPQDPLVIEPVRDLSPQDRSLTPLPPRRNLARLQRRGGEDEDIPFSLLDLSHTGDLDEEYGGDRFMRQRRETAADVEPEVRTVTGRWPSAQQNPEDWPQ